MNNRIRVWDMESLHGSMVKCAMDAKVRSAYSDCFDYRLKKLM